MIPRFLMAVMVAVSIAPPSAAQETVIGRVTAYNLPQIRVFSETGAPLGPRSQADLPALPATIVAVRGTAYGIRDGAEVIFVRGIDVRLELQNVTCRPREQPARNAGEFRPGVDAGSGSGGDCR